MRNQVDRVERKIVAVLIRWSRKREWVYLLDPGLMANPRLVVNAHAKAADPSHLFATHLMAIVPNWRVERTWLVKADGSIAPDEPEF